MLTGRPRTAARPHSSGVALLLALACGAGAATGADAQTTPDAPTVISPLRVETDVNDVNLVTGRTVLKTPTISVPAAPNLRFDWVQNAAPYVSGTITPGNVSGDTPAQASYSIHTGSGASESFKCPDMDCESVTGTGSTFVPNIYRFRQAGTGALWRFDLKHVDSQGPTNRTVLYYASQVTYPNGETISYFYDTATLAGDPYQRTFYRPNRVTSSLGYSIAITYQSNDFSQNAWASVAQATLSASADPSTPLARLTYSGNTITDFIGRTFTCTACANALGNNLETPSGSLTLPTEASPAHQVTASAQTSTLPIVGSVVLDGVTWTYSYANARLNNKASAWLYDSVTVTGPNGYHNVYTMTVSDQQNVITAQADSLSRTSTFAFDTAFRPTAVVAPEGNRVDVVYDDWGNIISKTTTPKPGSGLSAVTETAYVDAINCVNTGAPVLCYRPVYTRDALGRQTDYVYNAAGQVTEKTEPADANGVRRKTYVTYDASSGLSRPTVVRICGDITTCGTLDEVRTEYTYWGATMLPLTESHVDARAGVTLTTTYSYDAAGRPLSKDGPLPGTADAVYYKYDAVGRKVWEIGPQAANGYRTAKRFTYRDSDDKAVAIQTGSLTDVVNPAFLVTSGRVDTAYDAHRNPIREAVSGSDGLVYELTERSFDDRGQLVCQAQRMNAANFGATTDGCTLGVQGSSGPDRITHNVYDPAGQLTQVQRAYGTALQQNYASYEYTLNGKQKAVTDANGNRAEMSWDGFDRQKRWIFPSPTVAGVANPADFEDYGYDIVGNRVSLRKRDGVTLTYAYDGMNRLIVKSVPASASGAAAGYSIFYNYDVNGLQTYARFGSASGPGITTAYDGFGRVKSSTTTMDGTARTLSYAYDAHGNAISLSSSAGPVVQRQFDAADATGSIQWAGYTIATFAYDPAGRRSALGLGIGSVTSSASYGYDGPGRLQSLASDFAGIASDRTLTFGYNPASQMVTRTSSNDAFASTSATNRALAYGVNGLNQYSAVGGNAYTYDANGNLTSDGINIYVYDAENRLVSRSGGVTLAYDPNGRLCQATGPSGTRRFVYDGDRLVEEYDPWSLIAVYVHGPGADEPLFSWEAATGWARRYMHADHQGSIVALADDSGNAVTINAYDAWGVPNATNQGRFGYTGQTWLTDLGMWYYKARIYSPMLGRFLQTDPIGYKDQVNLYAYVGNDPVDGRDPTGLMQGLLPTNEGDPSYIADLKKGIREGATEALWEAGQKVWWLTAGLVSIPIGGPDEIGTWVAVNETMSAASRAWEITQGGRPGMAYLVNGVKFDAHIPGVLIDAKSGAYASRFVGPNGRFYPWFGGAKGLVDQARRQLAAAAGRARVEWRVQGARAASVIRQLLNENGVTGVRVRAVVVSCTGTKICPSS